MNQRRERILTLLKEQGELDVATLVRRLEASEATIRRDLTTLEEEGVLIRTFGGARLNDQPSLVMQTFNERRERMRHEKDMIARKAAELVKPGMVIALDSGTTVWRIAAYLKDKAPLTILTNALAPIEELGKIKEITIHCIGGRFRLENLDFIDPSPSRLIDDFRSDIAFIGADSIFPGKGCYARDEISAAIARALARTAEKRVVAADHAKFNAQGFCLVLPGAEMSVLITDQGLDRKVQEQLKNEPYEVIMAE